jgi:hypothetical protein
MHNELLVRYYFIIPYKGLTSINKPQKCQNSRFPIRQGGQLFCVARKVRSTLRVEGVDNNSTPSHAARYKIAHTRGLSRLMWTLELHNRPVVSWVAHEECPVCDWKYRCTLSATINFLRISLLRAVRLWSPNVFIMFTVELHWIIYWASWIQYTHSQNVSIRSSLTSTFCYSYLSLSYMCYS